jgi:hypothetical protein
MGVQTSEGFFFRVDREILTTKETPRYQTIGGTGRTGGNIPAGEPVYIPFASVSKNGIPYGYTLWATRIDLRDTNYGVNIGEAEGLAS